MTKKEEAIINTFNYLYCETHGICPKCGEYILLDGYLCFGCGYDYSESLEEEL